MRTPSPRDLRRVGSCVGPRTSSRRAAARTERAHRRAGDRGGCHRPGRRAACHPCSGPRHARDPACFLPFDRVHYLLIAFLMLTMCALAPQRANHCVDSSVIASRLSRWTPCTHTSPWPVASRPGPRHLPIAGRVRPPIIAPHRASSRALSTGDLTCMGRLHLCHSSAGGGNDRRGFRSADGDGAGFQRASVGP